MLEERESVTGGLSTLQRSAVDAVAYTMLVALVIAPLIVLSVVLTIASKL